MNLPFLQTVQGEDPIVMEAEYSVSVARLFRAWVTPEDIQQWFGAGEGGAQKARIDLRKGGSWEFVFAESEGLIHSLSGKYTMVEENKLLQFTWVHSWVGDDSSLEQSGESLVTIAFSETEAGSKVRLEHKGISAESSRNNVGSGWSMSLGKIKTLLE